MTDTPTPVYGLRQQSLGSNTNTWGDDKLNDVIVALAQLIGKIKEITISGDYTITSTNYVSTADNKNAGWEFLGALTANATITVPSSPAIMFALNSTTGGFSTTLKTAAGTGITIANGYQALLWCDGVNVYNLAPRVLGGDVRVGGLLRDVTAASAATDGVNKTQMESYVAAAIAAASGTLNGAFLSTYVYTMAGGETSVSGADDNGNVLAYTPSLAGQQVQVLINGAQQIAASDYTATTGTSITGMEALSADDVVVVIVVSSFNVANTYTQAQVDAIVSAAITTATNQAVPNIQEFTTPGAHVWTKPSRGTMALIESWGAGGSGARRSSGNASGGGSGGYFWIWVPLSSLGTTESITIASGGAVQLTDNTDGNAGGTSSFGTLFNHYGGRGGQQAASGNNVSGGGSGGPFDIWTAGGPNTVQGVAGIGGVGGTGTPNGTNAPAYAGGGGSGATNLNFAILVGQNAIVGPAGGAGHATANASSGPAGVSLLAGAGGAGNAAGAGGNGASPGGGGGSGTTQGGSGGNAKIRVTVF